MRRRTRPRRRGAAMIEFALVLPLLVTIMMGIIEFGRAMTVQTILTNAAREGARNAILAGATDTGVQTAVTTYLSNSGITAGSTTTITPTSNNATSGTVIHVTVSYPFSDVFAFPDWVGLKNVTLTSSVYMRRE
jgi:Flp pilus assembly protein TadG